ncbi:hypothetical protein Tco_0709272 [Tanacetum coccineum]
MIRSLMYLTASKPNIQFSICLYARYHANPKESHLVAVKRIFRKSTSGGCQILGEKLVCWSAKKQSSVAMSSAEAEYVDAAGCCAQVLWIKYTENFVPLPQKETVKAALATLGLVDENDPELSLTNLVNLSSLRIQYFSLTWRVLMLYIIKCLGGNQGLHDQLNINQQIIASSLCWGLDIDIASIVFSDLVPN